VVTHSDAILSAADVVLGVTKDEGGSRLVGVSLEVGSQFVKKEMAEGEQTMADGVMRTVPGKAKTENVSSSSIPAHGQLSPSSIPAPGQASNSGLRNPARLVSRASIAGKKKK
jgi:hypothetical protein